MSWRFFYVLLCSCISPSIWTKHFVLEASMYAKNPWFLLEKTRDGPGAASVIFVWVETLREKISKGNQAKIEINKSLVKQQIALQKNPQKLFGGIGETLFSHGEFARLPVHTYHHIQLPLPTQPDLKQWLRVQAYLKSIFKKPIKFRDRFIFNQWKGVILRIIAVIKLFIYEMKEDDPDKPMERAPHNKTTITEHICLLEEILITMIYRLWWFISFSRWNGVFVSLYCVNTLFLVNDCNF